MHLRPSRKMSLETQSRNSELALLTVFLNGVRTTLKAYFVSQWDSLLVRLALGALTAIIFALLAWLSRARDKKPEPIMLAIAAVTLSTMHQSSLGSLFLLMPDQLALQWWSPVMPISFFLSSIAAGTATVVLTEMWIAKAWNRPLRMAQLAAVGKITFWSLLIYLGSFA